MKNTGKMLLGVTLAVCVGCAAEVDSMTEYPTKKVTEIVRIHDSLVPPADCSGAADTRAYQCSCEAKDGPWGRSVCLLTTTTEVPRSVVRKGQSPTVWVTLQDRRTEAARESDPLCAAETGSACDPCSCYPHPKPSL